MRCRASIRSVRRSGTTLVECALVYPATLLLILGIMVGGMGMFRYQQISWLARQASHWASVRGSLYASETGNPAATESAVLNNAILPNAISLDQSKLGCTVTWSPNNSPPSSTVTVTVTYQWFPEVYLVGPFTMSSTSTMMIAY